jgi:ATP-dependent Clp protease ATP-binding subunit ClpX
MEKVKLEFAKGSLEAVAEEAIRRKSGARGLRAILESVMLDIMFDIPSKEGVREVLIDADVIKKKKPPIVVYDSGKAEKKAEGA